ncbi:MAG TPA: hypothetical protein VFM71_00550 [Gemmatimonadaceae bacterium]|nr:hypothetical protein [Gemmatimonadaceae bacterium]
MEAKIVWPVPCPFTVSSGLQVVPFAFDVRGDVFEVSPSQYGYLNIYDVSSAPGISRGFTSALVIYDPADVNKVLVQLDISAQPGNYVPGATYLQLRDSAHFDINSAWGPAAGWLILNGAASTSRGSMYGPSTLLAGQYNNWRAVTEWDTTAYRYRWIVDGTEVPASNYAQIRRRFSTVGAHTLKVLAERADLTVDTIVKTAYAKIEVQFSGPGVVEPDVNHTWSVTPLGGTGPYSYRWYLGGQYFTTGTSVRTSFPPNESHYFEVNVTDALGNHGSTAFTFYTTASGGGNVELRYPIPPK